MAAVLGIDPYQTAADVWARKTGRCDDSIDTPATAAGNILERAILDYAEGELGPLIRNQRRVHPDLPIAANIDAIVRSATEPVEGKSSGVTSYLDRDQWGEGGTDEVPPQYVVQCHVHMLCLDSKPSICHLAALIPPRGLVMYQIARNERLMDIIAERSVEFWKCVESDTMPEGSRLSLQVAKSLSRVEGKRVVLPLEAVREWELARAKRLAYEKVEEATEAYLLHCFGDAEVGELPDGRVLLYETHRRKGYKLEVPAFEYRMLKFEKGKKNVANVGDSESGTGLALTADDDSGSA